MLSCWYSYLSFLVCEASEVASGFWRGYRITIAHGMLLILSIVKVVMGMLWVALPAGYVFVASGAVGMMACMTYILCGCCCHRNYSTCCGGLFSLKRQLLMVRTFLAPVLVS